MQVGALQACHGKRVEVVQLEKLVADRSAYGITVISASVLPSPWPCFPAPHTNTTHTHTRSNYAKRGNNAAGCPPCARLSGKSALSAVKHNIGAPSPVPTCATIRCDGRVHKVGAPSPVPTCATTRCDGRVLAEMPQKGSDN
jgi:hypothetical protein